ncbi:MAG: hypothetical protein JSU86_17740 [Phycisphaerales bacterium]|nr:MAG: hypothetical protein JSU86_17740 [Phycisphaerales bacterium]
MTRSCLALYAMRAKEANKTVHSQLSSWGLESIRLKATEICAVLAVMGFVAFASAPAIEANAIREDASTLSEEALTGSDLLLDHVYALPPTIEIRRHVVNVGSTGCSESVSEHDGTLVYSNTLGQHVFGLWADLVGLPIADDITTIAMAGCYLDRYEFLVTGGRHDDGSGEGSINVDFALYDGCPGAGGSVIPGTEGYTSLPDEGYHLIVFQVPEEVEIPIPSRLWLQVSLSTLEAGIVVGAPALVGYSQDRFDFPGFPCAAGFGGFPDAPHTSFYTEIYVRGECGRSFVGYQSTRHGGDSFSAGAGVYFADDVRLGVRDCNMVGYEIAHKGDAVVQVDLRTLLNNANPDEGGLIPGTRSLCVSSGDDLQMCRAEFNPPIALPPDLWVVYKTDDVAGGPIVTCIKADPGSTEGFYMVFGNGTWQTAEFPNWPRQCWEAFELTIFCAGSPPPGACCDTVFADEFGEAVCRSMPQMNCPKRRWIEDVECDPDPFAPACGLSACCKPDDTCEDLTHNECGALVDPGAPVVWQRDEFCGLDDQFCFYYACAWDIGDCSIAHPEIVGCENPPCCNDVCDVDWSCCSIGWDEHCVNLSQEICLLRPPNDICYVTATVQALVVGANSETTLSNRHAQAGPGDPGFPCHTTTPGARGPGTVWFRFEATHRSARIHTCNSLPPATDSLVQLFRPLDTSTLQTMCSTLDTIACSDDAPECGGGLNSDVCVTGLLPGETYYILLASKTEETLGVYHLTVESPCPGLPPLCPPGKVVWLAPPNGAVDARQPHPPSDADDRQGIDTVVVEAPAGAHHLDCWSLCETALDPLLGANAIISVDDNGNGTYTIALARTITAGAVTTITYTDDDAGEHRGAFTSHPGNVNGDTQAAPSDILKIIDYINGLDVSPWGIYNEDVDQSGMLGPPDILRVIDLLNGAGTFDPWLNVPLPECGVCCP